MKKQPFGGAGKVGHSILSVPENRFREAFVDRIPRCVETYHLTILTLAWSLLCVFCGYLARVRSQPAWLWGVSFLICCQYVTDLFDGAIGRKRNTGLVKWGFFMDHFLDYLFLCSLILTYYLVAPAGHELWFLLLLVGTGGHIVHSYLAFAATNEFRIYFCGLGPTEMRIGFILINTFVIVTWPDYYDIALPVVTAAVYGALLFIVFRTHRMLWAIDMAAKAEAEAGKGRR